MDVYAGVRWSLLRSVVSLVNHLQAARWFGVTPKIWEIIYFLTNWQYYINLNIPIYSQSASSTVHQKLFSHICQNAFQQSSGCAWTRSIHLQQIMTVGPREQVFLAEEDSRVASLHQNWSCGCNGSVEVSVGKEMSIHIKQRFSNTEVSISIEGPNSEI